MQPMPAVAMRAIKHGAKHTPLNAIATVPAVASGKHVHAGTQMLRNRKHDNKIAVYSKSPKIATPMWTTTVVTSRHSGIVVNIPQTSGLNAELEPGHAETVSAIPVLTQITLKQIPGDYPLKPQGLNTDN
jgi:hypothetical protein